MEKLLPILCIFLITEVLIAQEQDEPVLMNSGQTIHSRSDFSISASSGFLVNSPIGNVIAGGLKIRVFVSKRFSFDSEIMFGRHFLQLAPGIIGIPAVLFGGTLGSGTEEDGQSFSEFLIIGAFIILSVEHFAYHIPVNKFVDISPYVSLLRFRQFENAAISENADGVESSACFAVGLELNKYLKKFILSPYVDYGVAYSGAIRGFTYGINFG